MTNCYLQSLQAVVVGEIKIERIVLKLHEMNKFKIIYLSVRINLYKSVTLLLISASLKMATDLCLRLKKFFS
jgi:hypothetical protein